jgi:two-component system response regulator RegA
MVLRRKTGRSSPIAGSKSMPRTRARSVLIVDDDTTLRERLVRAFRDRGYRARGAGSYDEAAAIVAKEPPDRVIVDLRMPGLSGLELVSYLKQVAPAAKIIVLTGYPSVTMAIDAIHRGAVSYLPKPADVDDILQAFLRSDPTGEPPRPDYTSPSLKRVEWEHIQRVLADCDGNISEAARRLGLYRRSLQRKLTRHTRRLRRKPRP